MENFRNAVLSLLGNSSYKVYIRNAGKFRFHSNYRFETHRHSEIEINYVNTGACMMEIENQFIPLKEGDCILVQPFVMHSFMVDVTKNCSITQLEFSVAIPQNLYQVIPAFDDENDFYKFASCNAICKPLENVCRSFREQKEGDKYSCVQLELALAQLYVALSGIMSRTQHSDEDQMQGVVGQVIQYMNDHFEEELNMEKIAERFRVSDRYIRKYFNAHMGMNCTQYISMLRIAKAKELLWDTSKSITEIALLTGFNSSHYFSRVFHKYMDMTPAAYRQLWRGTVAEINGEGTQENYG